MRPPVFLLGTGRCGSTLVQRILNTYPDVTIWGEHEGFLRATADQYFRLIESPRCRRLLFRDRPDGVAITRDSIEEGKRPDRWQAWLNWFSVSDLRGLFRDHLLSFFGPPFLGEDETWGFKEIRYGLDDRVVEFLADLFPDAIFIFVARNGFNTVASQATQGWSPEGEVRRLRLRQLIPFARLLKKPHALMMRSLARMGREETARSLQEWHGDMRVDQVLWTPRIRKLARAWVRQTRTLRGWHRSGRIHSYWVPFEDLVAGKPVLEPALQALGKTFGPDQRRVVELGEGRGEGGFSEKRSVGRRWGSLGFLTLAIVDWTLGGLNEELGYTSPDRAGWAARLRHALDRRSPQEGPRPAEVARETLPTA